MATSNSDVVILTIQRSCAKQLLVALTLALGGTPVPDSGGKKGKGKGKGGGGKSVVKSSGTSSTSTSTSSTSSKKSGTTKSNKK